eukprot:g46070.t1
MSESCLLTTAPPSIPLSPRRSQNCVILVLAPPLQLDPQFSDPLATISEDRKKGGEHAPIYNNRTEIERVKSIRFLEVTITDNLSWTSHDHKKLQTLVCAAQTITEANLPSMDSIYTAHCHRQRPTSSKTHRIL